MDYFEELVKLGKTQRFYTVPARCPKDTKNTKRKGKGKVKNKKDKYTNKYGKSNKNMTTKFLPFITENSEPLQIYQTLLNRSNGVSPFTLSRVFYAILAAGINEVRRYIKTLPEEMSSSAIYDAITNNFTAPPFNIVFLLKISSVIPPNETYWSPKLNKLSSKEALVFLYVLSFLQDKYDLREYTDLDFELWFKIDTEPFQNIQKYLNLSEEGEVFKVDEEDIIRALLIYHAYICKKKSNPIKFKLNTML